MTKSKGVLDYRDNFQIIKIGIEVQWKLWKRLKLYQTVT